MRSLSNTPQAYGLGMRLLHGSIAVLIVVQLLLGFLGDDLEPGESTLALWHATLGFLTLALVVVRFVWRALDVPPASTEPPGSLARYAAATTHVALYVLMLGLPVSGWLLASSETARIPLLGGMEVPALVATAPLGAPVAREVEAEDDDEAREGEGEADEELWEEVHEALAWLAVALVTLHTLAALKHRFARDGVFERMF